ncbi:NFX1-type zinc finger-containing protein 1 [Homalodisca vitripennis]|nr:NFX1-type zinc finger-containing protein 1 [Homalodisca vitripennis]
MFSLMLPSSFSLLGTAGDSLNIRCQNHPKLLIPVSNGSEIARILDKGCQKNCGAQLRCGHSCSYQCHHRDRKHAGQYKCCQKCGAQLRCGHSCSYPCHDRDREHAEQYKCGQKCGAQLRCGHSCSYPCHDRDREHVEQYKCGQKCGAQLRCGHSCSYPCHDRDREHAEQYKCRQKCLKTICGKSHAFTCGEVCPCVKTIQNKLISPAVLTSKNPIVPVRHVSNNPIAPTRLDANNPTTLAEMTPNKPISPVVLTSKNPITPVRHTSNNPIAPRLFANNSTISIGNVPTNTANPEVSTPKIPTKLVGSTSNFTTPTRLGTYNPTTHSISITRQIIGPNNYITSAGPNPNRPIVTPIWNNLNNNTTLAMQILNKPITPTGRPSTTFDYYDESNFATTGIPVGVVSPVTSSSIPLSPVPYEKEDLSRSRGLPRRAFDAVRSAVVSVGRW